MPPAGNQYDFIMGNNQAAKRGFGGSMKQRILIFAGGLIVLTVIGAVVAALLLGSDNSNEKSLMSLATKQTEIARVADIGTQKARGIDAKVLASTTKYSVTTDLSNSVALIKKNGGKADPKILALGKDNNTDKALATADQSNRFDEEFTKIITAMLIDYQKEIKAVHDASTSSSTKQVLAKTFKNATIILTPEIATQGGTAAPPTPPAIKSIPATETTTPPAAPATP